MDRENRRGFADGTLRLRSMAHKFGYVSFMPAKKRISCNNLMKLFRGVNMLPIIQLLAHDIHNKDGCYSFLLLLFCTSISF